MTVGILSPVISFTILGSTVNQRQNVYLPVIYYNALYKGKDNLTVAISYEVNYRKGISFTRSLVHFLSRLKKIPSVSEGIVLEMPDRVLHLLKSWTNRDKKRNLNMKEKWLVSQDFSNNVFPGSPILHDIFYWIAGTRSLGHSQTIINKIKAINLLAERRLHMKRTIKEIKAVDFFLFMWRSIISWSKNLFSENNVRFFIFWTMR